MTAVFLNLTVVPASMGFEALGLQPTEFNGN
jgi:hypothetical protein